MENNNTFYDCNIIICGPATGKTYLAEHDERFIDLDELKMIYKYGLENATREEMERRKLKSGKAVKENTTQYAINLLEEEVKKGNVVLISVGSRKLLKHIMDNGMRYCLVYASLDTVEEYIQRMKDRGNSPEFIERLTSGDSWETTYLWCKNDPNATYKIELKSGQYLSDIKDLFVKKDCLRESEDDAR